MINIGRPYIIDKNDCSVLFAPVSVSKDTAEKYKNLKDELPDKSVYWRVNEDYPPAAWQSENSGLWFEVPKEYGSYLCSDRSDAFLVAMFWYAFMTGSDISCEAPVSENVVFQINHYLQEALLKDQSRRIHIECETTDVPYPSFGAVGTGMSCGVDSIYTAWKYTQETIPVNFRLSALTYFYHGSIFHPDMRQKKTYTIKEFYAKTEEMALIKRDNAQKVADEMGLPLIYVKTNLDSDYYRGAFGYTAVYRNCACVLALQGYFSKYYLSSAGWPDFFELNPAAGSEHYETLLAGVFSTEGLKFLISDYVTRFQKTESISDYPIAQNHLDVCYNFNNCGECTKCRRTLLTLDILGKTDEFGRVFSIEKWKNDRVRAYAWMLEQKDGNITKNNHAIYAKDIYAKAVEMNAIPAEAVSIYEQKKAARSTTERKTLRRYLKKAVNICRKAVKR
ncbi:MAG: hypothetical protein Q4C20_01255 [Erysipelotrichaceae bacterium]|nr:hypothetical protein [Erysipelotrichaceae bacterium]